MADLEAVLADVSYLMAMEKSKSTPAARASKKIILPDPSVRSVMHKYLEKNDEISFDKIFNQKLGYLLFKEYCETLHGEPVPQVYFYEEIRRYERLETNKEREVKAREIYDTYIMGEELGRTAKYPADAVDHVCKHLKKNEVPTNLFQPYVKTIFEILESVFEKFLLSEKYTRFCQWKNLELNIQLTMNDFSFHRIIGRGGFGEVYGCRKADTGKMYAMKCLDKKRIKMKAGEMLALNERIMLSLVSTDLMNGGDLHYHLQQHGKFSEDEMRFYAAEVILGLEHMHSRSVVYRDLKPANILLDEFGHVRISDLGLACDFSKKLPIAAVGTHGYMAPEVLSKGEFYDSSADWFSLGCVLYKLVRGHNPFRSHRHRDKSEMDRFSMTVVEFPETFSIEVRSLLTGLLQRDVMRRLGCRGRGAEEIKSHPFFRGIDWRVVFLQRMSPPIIPARGEVNAADAFDIGSFDDEDTKQIRLTEADQELYLNFPVVVSERWQDEIAETIFDYINHEADKAEMKRKNKQKLGYCNDEEQSDCILHGYIKRLGGTFTATWLTRYTRLYPNRLELWSDSGKQPELIFMDQIEEVCNDYVQIKNESCIVIKLYNHSKYVLTNSDEIGLREWHNSLKSAHKESLDMMTRMAEKATKIYGTEIPLKHIGKRRQQLQQLEAQNQNQASGVPGQASAQPDHTSSSSSKANLEQRIIQKEITQASVKSKSVVRQTSSGRQSSQHSSRRSTRDHERRVSSRSRRHHSHRHAPSIDGTSTAGAGAAAEVSMAPPCHRHHHHHHHPHQHHHHRHHAGSRRSARGERHQPPPSSSSAPKSSSGAEAAAAAGLSGALASPTRQTRIADREDQPSMDIDSSRSPGELDRKDGDKVADSSRDILAPKGSPEVRKASTGSVRSNQSSDSSGSYSSSSCEQPLTSEALNKDVKLSSDSAKRMTQVPDPSKLASDEPRVAQPEVLTAAAGSIIQITRTDSEIARRSDKAKARVKATTNRDDGDTAINDQLDSYNDNDNDEDDNDNDNDNDEAQKPIKLAFSLENVCENNQAVLRDPQKRITSDNKKREQDLVAQFERLHAHEVTSSSSSTEE